MMVRSNVPKTFAQHIYFTNVRFSCLQTIRTTEYKMKLKQTGTALPNCGLKSAEACGAVERGVWVLMSERALSLCVKGVNGPTQGHSWALCSVSAGALKVEDYATSCDQTDASDKTHHTNRDSSPPAVGPHSEPRWRTAATLFSVSHLHPHAHTHTHPNQYGTLIRAGEKPTSGKQHEPQGSRGLFFTSTNWWNTLSAPVQ